MKIGDLVEYVGCSPTWCKVRHYDAFRRERVVNVYVAVRMSQDQDGSEFVTISTEVSVKKTVVGFHADDEFDDPSCRTVYISHVRPYVRS